MNRVNTFCPIIPLGREAHAIARQFAVEQATPQRSKQIYLNTLAVYAVHSYLKWLRIDTDLSQGDSWHPLKRVLFDIADLVLPGIGKLECRPVSPGETTIFLPPEVTEDRIGYVAVQFSENLNEVQLLGFVGAANISNASEQILIAELQPLDDLFDCIPEPVPQPVASASQVCVNLSQWLNDVFEAGWQTVEALLETQATNLATSTRSVELLREIYGNPAFGVTGGKLIDLERQAGQRVALIVKIVPKTEQKVDIRVRVCPASGQIYLPPNLQLIVEDESGTRLQAQAKSIDRSRSIARWIPPKSIDRFRSIDHWIQLEFSGDKGEQFSAKVVLNDVSITENFVI